MRKFLISAEQLVTIAFLILYAGTPLDLFLLDGSSGEVGDRTIFRLFFITSYIVSFLLLVLRWKKFIYACSRDRFIWLLLGVCALSSFWSINSDITIRRVFGLIGTTLFGLYFASRYTLKQQLKLCAYVFAFSAVMCFLFALFLPHYGLRGDAWRGIYTHKNVLGKRFVLAATIFFFFIITTRENRWVSWLGYITSGILVLLSKSASSLGNLIIMTAAVFIYYQILRLKYKIMMPILMLFSTLSVVFYVWFVTQADAILGLVGKDTTLTGRSELWPAVFEMIEKNPWLGYGYGAFWQNSNDEHNLIIQAIKWNAPNAHNGFLDIGLGLGLLGFSIFIIGFIINFLRAIYLIRLNETYINSWLLVYLTFIILSNLTETTLAEQNSLEWVLYVSAVFSSKIYTNQIYKNIIDRPLT
ncbi:O-antigen ligase family protein [Nostoc sp.]|uniref:O-antigen ligase family protein n=1 Tax=Nostoc sp. TaxID=1180 RepID=UPI0035930969